MSDVSEEAGRTVGGSRKARTQSETYLSDPTRRTSVSRIATPQLSGTSNRLTAALDSIERFRQGVTGFATSFAENAHADELKRIETENVEQRREGAAKAARGEELTTEEAADADYYDAYSDTVAEKFALGLRADIDPVWRNLDPIQDDFDAATQEFLKNEMQGERFPPEMKARITNTFAALTQENRLAFYKNKGAAVAQKGFSDSLSNAKAHLKAGTFEPVVFQDLVNKAIRLKGNEAEGRAAAISSLMNAAEGGQELAAIDQMMRDTEFDKLFPEQYNEWTLKAQAKRSNSLSLEAADAYASASRRAEQIVADPTTSVQQKLIGVAQFVATDLERMKDRFGGYDEADRIRDSITDAMEPFAEQVAAQNLIMGGGTVTRDVVKSAGGLSGMMPAWQENPDAAARLVNRFGVQNITADDRRAIGEAISRGDVGAWAMTMNLITHYGGAQGVEFVTANIMDANAAATARAVWTVSAGGRNLQPVLERLQAIDTPLNEIMSRAWNRLGEGDTKKADEKAWNALKDAMESATGSSSVNIPVGLRLQMMEAMKGHYALASELGSTNLEEAAKATVGGFSGAIAVLPGDDTVQVSEVPAEIPKIGVDGTVVGVERSVPMGPEIMNPASRRTEDTTRLAELALGTLGSRVGDDSLVLAPFSNFAQIGEYVVTSRDLGRTISLAVLPNEDVENAIARHREDLGLDRMPGLNLRPSQDGSKLYLTFKPYFRGNIRSEVDVEFENPQTQADALLPALMNGPRGAELQEALGAGEVRSVGDLMELMNSILTPQERLNISTNVVSRRRGGRRRNIRTPVDDATSRARLFEMFGIRDVEALLDSTKRNVRRKRGSVEMDPLEALLGG